MRTRAGASLESALFLSRCAAARASRFQQTVLVQALRGPLVFCSSHPRGFAWPSTVPHAPRLADITTKRRHRLPALSDAEQYFLLVPGNEHIDGIDSAPCQKVSAAPAAMKTPVRAASFLQKRRLLPGRVALKLHSARRDIVPNAGGNVNNGNWAVLDDSRTVVRHSSNIAGPAFQRKTRIEFKLPP